jgi:hypothetical protein
MAMIRANVFSGKKTPPSSFLNSLVVKGGVEAIDPALKRLVAWNGSDPVCCPVTNIKEDGTINTTRWALLGSLDKNPRLLASNLFSGVDKDIVITIPIDDLKIFEFKDTNASHWIESSELQAVIYDKAGKKELSEEEAQAKGIGAFCIRTVLQPDSHATALMWMGLVPLSKEELRTKLPGIYNRTCCPQIALALGTGGARARRIMMAVREKEHDGFGFGCFPLIEDLKPGDTTLPPARDLKEVLYRFMHNTGGTNNRSSLTIMQALESNTEAEKETPPQSSWPQMCDNSPIAGDEGRKTCRNGKGFMEILNI